MMEFETIEKMKDFLYENGIDVLLSDLKYAVKTGNLFLENLDFNCYFDEFNNVYVLEV